MLLVGYVEALREVRAKTRAQLVAELGAVLGRAGSRRRRPPSSRRPR
ncbi:hypothetical protein [Kitasatospora sp. KL5]